MPQVHTWTIGEGENCTNSSLIIAAYSPLSQPQHHKFGTSRCRENPTEAEAYSILDWNGQGHGAILQELYGVPKVQAANADTRSNDKYSNWTLREKESTLSREVEWEPASIEHFSVPADSTPQPDIVPEVPPAVLPPIDLEGQEAPPTLNHAQRRYPQRDRRPPDYYSVQF